MNKPQLVSFFVYRRQSRDRFSICVKWWAILSSKRCWRFNVFSYCSEHL